MTAPRVRLVCLVGPTTTGKTALALELAERVGAEIVSADSRQVYRRLDVGTAKPTPAERARVRHHCVDLVDPDATFDAARFRAAAVAAITDATARGRPVLVVGGTGLWLRALLHGLCPAPARDPDIRAAIDAVVHADGAPAVHRRLAVVDPAAAARIHPNDRVRSVRALEVALASGRPLSDWQAAHAFVDQPFDALVVGLARPVAELDARIAARAAAMVEAGFLDEVRALAQGVPADAPAWRTVGYREMRACVEGQMSVEAALAATVAATRRFAKRQRTWFRRETGVVWRHPEADRERIVGEACGFLAGRTVARAGLG
jgi:tRNA dimethylallyltransferase